MSHGAIDTQSDIPVSRLSSVLTAACLGGWGAWARESTLRGTTGFDEAWATTNQVPGWLSAVNAATFWGVIAELRPTRVVEIGSYLGRSTVLLALGLRHYVGPAASVVAIDPHTGDRQHLEALGLDRLPSLELFRLHVRGAGVADLIDERVQKSDEVAMTWENPIDLLYVDGWHSYEAVRRDAVNFGTWLSPRGVVCFDDYAQYDEVRRAVDEACTELGLTLYGVTTLQAWAGRSAIPPNAVAAVIRKSKSLHRLRNRLLITQDNGYPIAVMVARRLLRWLRY
jgi:predicted O-methyltransferase YrrM